ncbi:MAG TPA: Hpt domain-containing protein [Planctomycetota bacterium]|nr:Hpt domain-containing protein [Planctomycetota bacterium]
MDIDSSALQRLVSVGGRDLLDKMIGLFLENTPGRLSVARSRSDLGDWSSVERAAHSMKSSAAYLGLRDFRVRAERIETCAREGLRGDLGAQVEGLLRAFDAAREGLPQAVLAL